MGTLEGVRVLDMADESAVFATRILTDLGADVIRVEPPDGGRVRRLEPYLHDRPGVERSLYHLYHNASKRSVTLDITSGAGADILRRLAADADVLVETSTPGYMSSLGLGYSDLQSLNQGLIYVSVTPFGQTGSWKNRKANDLVAAAAGGLLHISGESERVPTQMGADQSYKMASLAAATGVLVALTGRKSDPLASGAHLDISLQECVTMAVLQTANPNYYGRKGVIPQRPGISSSVFQCADGSWATVNARVQSLPGLLQWASECGIETDLTEERWAELQAARLAMPNPMRESPAHELVTRLAASHTRDQFLKKSWEVDLFALPVSSFPDLLASDQLLETGQFFDVADKPLDFVLKFPRSPVDATAAGIPIRRAPTLGEHNLEVYGQLGLSADDLARLSEQGVV